MICYGQYNNGRECQEHYETASRDAGRRSKRLRKAGYKVFSSSGSPQITRVGLVKLTTLTINPGGHPDTYGLPNVQVATI